MSTIAPYRTVTPAMVILFAKDQVVHKYTFSVLYWTIDKWNDMVFSELQQIDLSDESGVSDLIYNRYRGLNP